MNDLQYLTRMFKTYYQEERKKIPAVDSFTAREFAFIHWEKSHMMIRHIGFNNAENLREYLVMNNPKHVYSSASLYESPDYNQMDEKGYRGCDFVIDIDVDHFFTPCKEDHDIWACQECRENGRGMPPTKCPECGNTKFDTLSWICQSCLEKAKNEIVKLIYDFLLPDFNIQTSDLAISFSGHRGYHLRVSSDKIRSLSSDSRREIVDYLTGSNISFELLGLKEKSSNIFGLSEENVGWARKIVLKIKEILNTYNDKELTGLLQSFGFTQKTIESFLSSKNNFTRIINDPNLFSWSVEGFGIKRWKKFLAGITDLISAEIDKPVSIDIHRLIRYPGTLHGKTGFKVQNIPLNYLESFEPLDELDDQFDPIVFYGEKNRIKVKISEKMVPQTRIKNNTFGPFNRDEVVELPNHMAIFLVCKGVATFI
ncbi:MAG: DNA primase small subunit domain-containing protein [Promethearchaeia archaeon]